MLKRLLLLWVFSASLSAFSQERSEYTLETKDRALYIQPPDTLYVRVKPAPDTLRAELLVTYTTRRWGVAHSRDGYVVRKGAEVIDYLDNNHKPFPVCVTVWGWVKWEERKSKNKK